MNATVAGIRALVQTAGDKLTVSSEPMPVLAFRFEPTSSGYAETAVSGWGTELAKWREPMDVVIGSGKRGQSFLYWSGDRLFELPVSYWRDGHRWINSPGYVDGTADFHRPVQPGCLECHATNIVPLSSDLTANSYERSSFVPGIHCQTCHGNGEAHVTAETQALATGHKPASDPGILNPARFSRDRQVDLCAVCHSGIQRRSLQPAFSYKPGEPLSRYFEAESSRTDERPDVHGNQVGLLKRSRCFAASEMTCSTCHDVHTTGKPVAAYASRCLTCHQVQSCGEAHKLGASITTRCVECHMPVQRTEAIVSVTTGERIQPSMRTHWIKVYGQDSAASDQAQR